MTAYSPWRHLRSMPDVIIDYDPDLPSGHAWWSPAHQVILMAAGLTSRQRRVALAHELAHIERGDAGVYGPDGPRLERRQEVAAEQLAARWLIDLDDLMDALAWCRSLDEVAEELNVDRSILEARLALLDAEDQAIIAARFFDDWSVC